MYDNMLEYNVSTRCSVIRLSDYRSPQAHFTLPGSRYITSKFPQAFLLVRPHPSLYNPLRLYANKFDVPAGIPVRTFGVATSLSLAHNAAADLGPSSARKYAPNPAICAAAIEVPEKVTTAVLEAIPREGISWPGAKISTVLVSDNYKMKGVMLCIEMCAYQRDHSSK